MKKNQSQEQLIKSQERRIKHLMIRVLEGFEASFPDIDQTSDGSIFKSELRTIFNDVIRAQRDEIREYDVDYRPLKTNDSSISVTKSFIETVQKIDFNFISDNKPTIKISSPVDKFPILEAIRNEFGVGVIYKSEDILILEIVGTESCINHIIPTMDKYYLHDFTRNEYKKWRNKVIGIYRS